jgi:anaerobic selenocysteine-containing dehydrogenase
MVMMRSPRSQAMRDGRSRRSSASAAISRWRCPIPNAAFAAFRKLDLSVHIITKLNRTALLTAKDSIILPCLGRTEYDVQGGRGQAVTVEDSMSMVHASRGRIKPASPAICDPNP